MINLAKLGFSTWQGFLVFFTSTWQETIQNSQVLGYMPGWSEKHRKTPKSCQVDAKLKMNLATETRHQHWALPSSSKFAKFFVT